MYVSEANNRDVVVLGEVTFIHERGESTTQDFAGNFAFAKDYPLIEHYQAWLVSKFNISNGTPFNAQKTDVAPI